MKQQRLIFCGDRNWQDEYFIRSVGETLRKELGDFVMIEGEARGADRLSKKVALFNLGVEVVEFPANWAEFGRAAGAIRNEQMLKEGKATGVVAFHDDIYGSKGTRNMVDIARKAGLPVWGSWEGSSRLPIFISMLRGEPFPDRLAKKAPPKKGKSTSGLTVTMSGTVRRQKSAYEPKVLNRADLQKLLDNVLDEEESEEAEAYEAAVEDRPRPQKPASKKKQEPEVDPNPDVNPDAPIRRFKF